MRMSMQAGQMQTSAYGDARMQMDARNRADAGKLGRF